VLFLIPITKSSIKRWIDDIGVHLPTPEEILRHLLALSPTLIFTHIFCASGRPGA
jgi:hypothetical protein